MTTPITADELADELVGILDSMMIREEDEPAWLGASSTFQDEVVITVGDQRFELTIREVGE